MVNGKEQDVAFAVKQKYGGSRFLVMADPTSMKEIFSPDGETSLPLPAFSADAVIARAPHDITALARFTVPGHWDLPNLKFADALRPELAPYFAQFKQFPDANDDPDELEALGFKDPNHFIRRYHQKLALEQAAGASANSGDETIPKQADAAPLATPQRPLSGEETNGSNLSLTMHGGSDQCGDGDQAPASGTQEPLEITTEDIEGERASDRSDEPGRNDQNGQGKPVEEGEEEEEVENALAESLPNQKRELSSGNTSASTGHSHCLAFVLFLLYLELRLWVGWLQKRVTFPKPRRRRPKRRKRGRTPLQNQSYRQRRQPNRRSRLEPDPAADFAPQMRLSAKVPKQAHLSQPDGHH